MEKIVRRERERERERFDEITAPTKRGGTRIGITNHGFDFKFIVHKRIEIGRLKYKIYGKVGNYIPSPLLLKYACTSVSVI